MTHHQRLIGKESPTTARGYRAWPIRAGLLLAAAAIVAVAVLVTPTPALARRPRGVIEVAPPSDPPAEVLQVRFTTLTILNDADPYGTGEWELTFRVAIRAPGCEARLVSVTVANSNCSIDLDERRMKLRSASAGHRRLNFTLPDGRTDHLTGFPVRRGADLVLEVFADGEDDDGFGSMPDYLGNDRNNHMEGEGAGWGAGTAHSLMTRHFRVHYTINLLATGSTP